MVDCTRTLRHSTPVPRLHVLAVTMALIVLALAAFPATGAADGDPASDVLATQSVYLPQDTGATATQQAELGAIESVAQKSGYQIRVAMIAAPSDLGSVGALWRQPQSYAEFLGQELSLVYRGTLLVVMPNGFGLYEGGRPTGAGRSALAAVPAPGSARLVDPTLSAIQRLAAASGHPLMLTGVSAPAAAGSNHTGTWIALAIGVAVIAAAWAASLHALPLRATSRRSAAT
jgi:hypothetical protein